MPTARQGSVVQGYLPAPSLAYQNMAPKMQLTQVCHGLAMSRTRGYGICGGLESIGGPHLVIPLAAKPNTHEVPSATHLMGWGGGGRKLAHQIWKRQWPSKRQPLQQRRSCDGALEEAWG